MEASAARIRPTEIRKTRRKGPFKSETRKRLTAARTRADFASRRSPVRSRLAPLKESSLVIRFLRRWVTGNVGQGLSSKQRRGREVARRSSRSSCRGAVRAGSCSRGPSSVGDT